MSKLPHEVVVDPEEGVARRGPVVQRAVEGEAASVVDEARLEAWMETGPNRDKVGGGGSTTTSWAQQGLIVVAFSICQTPAGYVMVPVTSTVNAIADPVASLGTDTSMSSPATVMVESGVPAQPLHKTGWDEGGSAN